MFSKLLIFEQGIIFTKLQETTAHQYWLLQLPYYMIICSLNAIYFCYMTLNSTKNPIRVLQKKIKKIDLPVSFLTPIWVGFLGVCFEVQDGGGGVKLPYLTLVRIMLETSNLASKYTPICSFRKYTF